MDLKGPLVDTDLRIYPSQQLTAFLKTLPDNENIPENILKLLNRSTKNALQEEIDLESITQLTNANLELLNKVRAAIKKKQSLESETKEVAEEKSDEAKDVAEENSEESNVPTEDESDEPIEKNNIKEKSGDTPEKLSKKELSKGKSSLDTKEVAQTDTKESEEKKDEAKQTGPYLTASDIGWLYTHLKKRKSKGEDVPYLHALMEGTNVEFPENPIIKRNPELEARCVKLRAQQEAREYRKMTKTVDNVRMKFPEDSISYQMKQLNRQLIAIGQFIISIFAGFLFGFRGVEWMVGNLDFGFRLLLGVMCALVIALAEIYFLAKKLNEELNIPETVQLGGPPKFVDEHKYMNSVPNKIVNKEHQE